MPRRNKREAHEPLDLTPADIEVVRRQQRQSRIERPAHEIRRERAEKERVAYERQRDARINNGIDWSVCLVPGCGEELFIFGTLQHDKPSRRDHTTALPLCIRHLGTAFVQANHRADDALMVNAVTLVLERRAEKAEAFERDEKKAWLERNDGHIYFVRLNGLVKVGWSRAVHQRLRAYGPLADVLCIYPGTRTDETNLHRQLRPVLARGREWYEDCKIIADFVARAVEEHGPPTVHDEWTKPKAVIRPRRRSA